MAGTLGLIAGNGSLPLVVAREAREKGFKVIAVALEPLADYGALAPACDSVFRINVGKLGRVLDTLKQHGIKEAVMAGKVPKSLIYKSRVTPDLRAIKILMGLKDRKDDTILLAITRELESEGISLLKTTDFCASILVPEGVLSKRKPTKDELKDVEFGFRMAKGVGGLDIGQTVVVKGRAVMAVEAIEGTDEAIRRGGRLAGGDAVVVKVAKPAQDMRFDVPAAGPGTVEAVIEAEGSVLALEAGATLFLEREKALRAANEAGISVVGVKGD